MLRQIGDSRHYNEIVDDVIVDNIRGIMDTKLNIVI